MAVRQASAMPRTGAPPMIGETPTTVLALTASAMPGTARMMPMLTTGFDGGSRTKSAASIASSTPGAGFAPAAPAPGVRRRQQDEARGLDRLKPPGGGFRAPRARRGDLRGGHRGVQPHPPLLEVHGAPALAVVEYHPGLDPVIGHRQ